MTKTTLYALILGSVVAASASPASAVANGWSPTAVLLATCGAAHAEQCSSEPAPRAAVNARGQALVAWVDKRTRVQVASAAASGRFGRPVTLGKGLRPSVAISAGGTQLVAWSNARRLHFARRAPGHRFSRPFALLVPGGGGDDDSPKLAAQPGGGTLVVFENTYRDAKGTFHSRLRSVVVSARGRLGAVQELGDGSLRRDSFRAAASGQAAVCCLAGPPPATPAPLFVEPPRTNVATYLPGVGWSIVKPTLGASEAIETVAPRGGALALGTIDTRNRGDAGSFGVPGMLRVAVGGAIGPVRPAPVVVPRRSFGPVVAIDGAGRDVLVYQEKDHAAAFSRRAPLYAVTAPAGEAFATRRRLDGGEAYQPAVLPYRDGAIVAWQAAEGRWRLSIERGGSLRRAPAPSGPGPSHVGEDFNYNHDMATRGRHVVLCWTALDGSVRASVGTL